jgi:hypothetical protein
MVGRRGEGKGGSCPSPIVCFLSVFLGKKCVLAPPLEKSLRTPEILTTKVIKMDQKISVLLPRYKSVKQTLFLLVLNMQRNNKCYLKNVIAIKVLFACYSKCKQTRIGLKDQFQKLKVNRASY